MKTQAFYDQPTGTLTYVVWNEETRDAVLIDPVLNFDSASGMYSYESVDEVSDFVKQHELHLHMILETHAHADHLSGSQALKKIFPQARLAIGQEIRVVQETFKAFFNLGESFKPDGHQFDLLLEDGGEYEAGALKFRAISTPGHTPACYSYLFGDALFTGDALFMPDFGVARCDFPKGDAGTLYDSITQKIYTLPDETRIFTGHDYQPNGRELQYQSTVKESKENNILLNANTSKEDFVRHREERDATLPAPKLLLPSVQVNIDAGHLPAPDDNGVSYLRIPMREKS